MMVFAVVRIRGGINAKREVRDTLKMLNLTRVNHCTIIPENASYKGMLSVVKDYVTWGEITPEMAARIIVISGRLKGGGKITDAYIREHTGYSSILAFSKALCAGKAKYGELRDVVPVFRLPPPRKGYEGIKRSYTNGGAAGYRGKDIASLLERMLPPPPAPAKKSSKTKASPPTAEKTKGAEKDKRSGSGSGEKKGKKGGIKKAAKENKTVREES